MKITKIILCLGLLWMVCAGTAEAKKHRVKQKSLYMMGVAISHLDSAVFITDMMLVEGLTVEKKTKFLMDRQLYSLQLKSYLESAYEGGPFVPAVYFSTSKKKMERRYLSMHKRYMQGGEMQTVLVDQSQFRFKAEEYVEDSILEGAAPSKKNKTKATFKIETPNVGEILLDAASKGIEEHEKRRAAKTKKK